MTRKYLFLCAGALLLTWWSAARPLPLRYSPLPQGAPTDSLPADSTRPDSTVPYRPSTRPNTNPSYRFGDPFANEPSRSPLLLDAPSNVNLDVQTDTSLQEFIIRERVGDTIDYRPPSSMSYEEYDEYMQRRLVEDYFRQQAAGLDGESAMSGRNLIPKIYISPALDRVFGGNYVDIRPNGSVLLDFGGQWQKTENPALPVRQQRFGQFRFDQQVSLNVIGKIGEKMQLTINYDTKSSFQFENNVRLEYTGYDHEIIQKIEAGNVSLPISSGLIQGAQNLFGIKTQLRFGRMLVTGLASFQQGETDQLTIQGGAQSTPFNIRADAYEDNKHFFLSHFFRDRYEQAFNGLPANLSSGVNITRVEVYVTNRNNNTEALRNVVALHDLGEPQVILRGPGAGGPVTVTPQGGISAAANGANSLFGQVRNIGSIRDDQQTTIVLEQAGYVNGTDFAFIKSARRLQEGVDFRFHPQLGYITLTTPMRNDDILGVSFEYTFNGQQYKVGELTEDYQSLGANETVILKMLRTPTIQTRIPVWDLMMKNVYSLNASQVSRENFLLRVIYRDDISGADNPVITEGPIADQQLLQVLRLDRFNINRELQPDGNFDFFDEATIDARTGRVFFPVLEPFGSFLRSRLQPNPNQPLPPELEKYVYSELYDSTKSDAQQQTNKNKYFLDGSLQASASNDIQLPGIDIAEGSVVVTANDIPLDPSQYSVDYQVGRVTILDQSVLASNAEIKVRFEKAALFQFQQRSLVGVRSEYQVNEDFIVGGTLLHLNERPVISRVSLGAEPTKNTMLGVDVNYQSESRILTKIIDKIPLIQTKAPSLVSFSGEYAQLRPGSSRLLRNQGGVSFIDDFENAETNFRLGRPLDWALAATPRNDRFPEASLTNDIRYGFRRAKLAWYVIDNNFFRDNSTIRPDHLEEEDLRVHYVRAIDPQEVFPGRDLQAVNLPEPAFNLAYYPAERGPYNYARLTAEGTLPTPPEQNWGGLTQSIVNVDTDFDNANIEYIEFWLMDPFIAGPRGREAVAPGINGQGSGGKLYLNLGSVSEDLLRDNLHAFENGLPTPEQNSQSTQSAWGRVTLEQYLTDAFDNTPGALEAQDVGFDGLSSTDEQTFFQDYLNGLTPEVRAQVSQDPSGDDFQYFLGPELDDREASILDRYKNFNNPDGNSPTSDGGRFVPAATNQPDNEDQNRDNTVNDIEAYYEYEIDLQPNQIRPGRGYVVDQISVPNDEGDDVNWYQFRIPIRDLNSPNVRRVGNINDFKSMRFLRMYLTGFAEPVVLRFIELQFVASQWRNYIGELTDDGFDIADEEDTQLTIATVNIEENSDPNEGQTPYVSPPGVIRDIDNTSLQVDRRLNEQSLSLCVDNLDEGEAEAVFKNYNLNLINYERVQMYIHASSDDPNIRDEDVSAFVRLGTDFDENYYEIEIPLQLTAEGTTDPDAIWPTINEVNITLNDLAGLKANRNRAGFNFQQVFPSVAQGQPVEGTNQQLRIKGNPDFSSVQTVMLGLKMPNRGLGIGSRDVCVWMNELRVTGFDKTPGWAATGRLNARLADFATLSAQGRYTSIGFGSIDQNIAQRSRANTSTFGASTTINLNKFVPDKVGLRLPLFLSYERRNVEPQFDPLNPDVKREASVSAIEDAEERAFYDEITQDRTTRRSINLTNVQKVKTNPEAKARLYDIENVTLTAAYSDLENVNHLRETFEQRQYLGALAYNYSNTPPSFEPFKEAKLFSSPFLQLIRDFNVSPLPNNLAFRAELNRTFEKEQLRGNNVFEPSPIDPTFIKSFTFNRLYNLRWALTQGLSLDYTANVQALIDEPEGDIDGTEIRPGFTREDSVRQNLRDFGRIKNFDQRIQVNYTVPFDKLPFTNFVRADVQYTAGYLWTAAPLGLTDETFGPVDTTNVIDTTLAPAAFGNTMQNNRQRAVNGQIDLLRLYNKVKFLKEINSPPRGGRAAPGRGGRSGTPRPPGRQAEAEEDSTKKQREFKAFKSVLRLIMSVRSVNFNYSLQEGTVLPNYLPLVDYAGYDVNAGAPGVPFLLGSQDPTIRFEAARNGWLGTSPSQNAPFTQTRTENLTVQTQVEPVRDFRIQVDARKTKTALYSEIFVDTTGTGDNFISLTPAQSGTYNISFISIATAFDQEDTAGVTGAFRDFVNNRFEAFQRLSAANPNAEGEYQLNSQSVLVNAFLAAYSGRDLDDNYSAFPRIPLPNWRVDYGGLAKLGWFRERFSTLNITHGYSSSYTVGNFRTSLQYGAEFLGLDQQPEDYIFPSIADTNAAGANQWVPVYVLPQVAINERFAPLIGINVRTKKQITFRADYNRERAVALNLTNAQITETLGNNVTVGIGFVKSNLKLPIRARGRQIVLKNELTFRGDVSVSDIRTVQRQISEDGLAPGLQQTTAGRLNIQIRPTLNYQVNRRLSLQGYFERSINRPRITTSFPISTTRFGVQVRFSLT